MCRSDSAADSDCMKRFKIKSIERMVECSRELQGCLRNVHHFTHKNCTPIRVYKGIGMTLFESQSCPKHHWRALELFLTGDGKVGVVHPDKKR